MKNLTWQNPEQLFVAQVLINKVKSKCCGIKVKQKLSEKNNQYDEVYRLYKMVSKKKNVLKNTLLYVKAHINKMLALVNVPALKLLSQRIAKDVNLVEHTNCVYEEVQ